MIFLSHVLRDEPSTTGLRPFAQSLLRMSGNGTRSAHPEERLRSREAASRRRVSKDVRAQQIFEFSA